MIGGISFSATSITSGLDIDKPVSPRPGHQYLATDTKKQYNCFIEGVWSSVNMLESVMAAGTDVTLVIDSNIYNVYTASSAYVTIHQYTVNSITGFTRGQGFYIGCDFAVNLPSDTTSWYILLNGVTKLNGTYTGYTSWKSISGTINEELQEGDVIELGMQYPSIALKWFECKNLTIKCATPAFIPKISLV